MVEVVACVIVVSLFVVATVFARWSRRPSAPAWLRPPDELGPNARMMGGRWINDVPGGWEQAAGERSDDEGESAPR